MTREGGRAVREEALPAAKSWGTSRQAFAPSWQLDLTLELSSFVLFYFLFLGGWLQIILFCLHYTQVLWYKRLAGANMSRLH